ncbi:hypothetical protein GF352_00205 [archaeon]|nr:hypothetical protein [archaeon]
MTYPDTWQCPSCGSTVYNSIKCTTCNYQPPAESGALSAAKAESVKEGYSLLKKRITAFLIDSGIIIGIALILSLTAGFLLSDIVNKSFSIIFLSFGIPIILVFIVFHPLYFLFLEGFYAQTYGKKLMGLKVAADEGMGFKQSLIRNLLRFIEAIPLYIPSIIMIKKDGRRLGDRLANTSVISK